MRSYIKCTLCKKKKNLTSLKKMNKNTRYYIEKYRIYICRECGDEVILEKKKELAKERKNGKSNN